MHGTTYLDSTIAKPTAIFENLNKRNLSAIQYCYYIGMECGTMHNHTAYYTHTLSCYIGFFDQNEINKIMEESVKMKEFNHPNVMSLIGVCTDAGPAPYIIMPFMANGSLLSYLRKERQNILLKETADDDLVSVQYVSSFILTNISFWLSNFANRYLKVIPRNLLV